MNKKITISLIIVVILFLCIVFRFMVTKNAEKQQAVAIQQSMTPKVEVIKPFDIETSSTIEAPGRVVAVNSVDVIARVQGMILTQNYKDGDYVKQGQLLYSIDPNEFQIARERAKANLESAKAEQYRTQKDFERAKELVEKDFVSKSAYDQALSAKDAASANVRAASAALNDANRLLSYTKVTAPISGKISNTVITVGNYLSSPNTQLTKIVSIDPIFVTYSLDSKLYNQLKNDEIIPTAKQTQPIKVEVTLPDGTVYSKKGNADFSDNSISQTTGSIALRATFPNPDGTLIPGDFVNVKVHSNKVLTRLAVPQAAVLQDTNGRYLFVVDENNIAHKKTILTDGQKGDNWIVLSGVTKQDNIVSTGIIKVRDNAPVEVINKNSEKTNKEQSTEDLKEQKSNKDN